MINENEGDWILFSAKFVKQKEYWLKKLAGDIAETGIFFNGESKKNQKTKKNREKVKILLPNTLCRQLKQLSKNSELSVYIILVTALKSLIYRYSNNEDITVISPIHKHKRLGDTINEFLLIRDSVNGDMTFKKLLLQIRQSVLEAYANQDYPFDKLLEFILKVSPSTLQENRPITNIVCSLNNIHDNTYVEVTNAHLSFSFSKEEDRINGELSYDANMYEIYYVRKLSNHFVGLLENAMADVNTKVSLLSFLSARDRKQLLVDFNNNRIDFPADKTVYGLIEEQVEKIPDRVAVSYEGTQLTYCQLNERANQLARFLRNSGIQREQPIGMMLNRSPRMVESILASWKAGAAYLPIDGEYPLERIKYILGNSQTPLLLTEYDTARKFSYTLLKGLQECKAEIHKTALRPQITDFDNIPFPDRSLVNYEKYNRFIGITLAKNSMAVQGTRGCPFNCAFCHKIWPKNHVFRSAEKIFEEVKLLYSLGVRRFTFIDDIFNLNVENSTRFFQLVIANELDIQLFFPNGVRGDILTKEYIDLMVKSGTTSLALALETASPRLQKMIGKNLNLKKFRENIEYITSTYPQLISELFTMIGFPTETEEEAMMTLNFLKSLKWVHFPDIEVLRIFPNTDIEKIALANGVSREAIARSENLAFHEYSETLPFDKNFTSKYQTDSFSEYFLSKERLLHVLPYQLQVLTKDEMVQKYNSYLPVNIETFDDLLQNLGITKDELNQVKFLDESNVFAPGFNHQLQKYSPKKEPADHALRVLLLDLSLYFSSEVSSEDIHFLYEPFEPPLGLIYLMTYLNQHLGSRVNGKIAKSRMDFDNYEELKALLVEFKPDVIGVRTLNFYKEFFHRTINLIRQWGFDAPIITGGPYATSDYKVILQDRNIDLVVLGEGEITFSELVAAIMENSWKLPNEEVLKDIPGIAFVPQRHKQQNHPMDIVILDDNEFNRKLCCETGENPKSVNKPSDLAYIIYTSGSTGKPKGAMVEHRGMMNHIQAKICDLHLSEQSIIAQNASHTFDISVWQWFAPLVTGGKTVIYSNQLMLEPDRLIRRVKQDRVNILELVPSYLPVILDNLSPREVLPLDFLLVTGEALKSQTVAQWFGKYPGIKMVNAYGPTEASDDITHHILDEAPSGDRIPIGKSLQNLDIYIVDKNMNLCPVGVKGEICVSGVGVGRGYLNNPELTREKFFSSPFTLHPSPLYKTGDLGCWLPDGPIEFFGRKDYQVKMRGYRIELEEIESILLDHPNVKNAVAIDREDEKGGLYLCAYLVMVTGGNLDVVEIKEYLARNLPRYMVPGYVVKLESIPLTSNGKVDRKSLPEPGKSTGLDYTAPKNDVQKRLVNIWSEVLEIGEDTIGIDTNFFEMGGQSLKAIKLGSYISKEFNIQISIKEIFRSQTIRELAEYIKNSVEDKYKSIRNVEEKEYYPLSSAQKRMYSLFQMKEDILYNAYFLLTLEGNLDERRLENTFRKLIERHESLRTSFEIVNRVPVPVQRIHKNAAFAVEFYNGMEQWEAFKEDAVADIIQNFIRPFDLAKAPLFRVGLVHVGETKHIMILDIHHILSDGISDEIAAKEFNALYEGKSLHSLRLRYKDYSEWQNSKEQRESVKKQEAFWLNLFAGEIPVLNLPTDYDRPRLQDSEGNFLNMELRKQETKGLNALARQEDATLYMVLLSIYYILLAKISSQEDIIIGTPVVGRRHADLENIIGIFLNTLALRNYPAGNKTYVYFLKEVKKSTLEAFDNQDYPFEELAKQSVVKRDPSRNPLFDVMFDFNLFKPEPLVVNEGKEQSPAKMQFDFKRRTAKVDLCLLVNEINGRLYLGFEYCTKLFKKETVDSFFKYLQRIIEQVTKNEKIKIEEIELLDVNEKLDISSVLQKDRESITVDLAI